MGQDPEQSPSPTVGETTVLRDWDPPLPSARTLLRHGSDVRQPAGAPRVPGRPQPRATVYMPQRLILPGGELLQPAMDAVQDAVNAVAGDLEVRPASLYGLDAEQEHRRNLFSETVELVPKPGTVAPTSTDAWRVLQKVRVDHPDLGRRISLEHIAFAPAAIGGTGPHTQPLSPPGVTSGFDDFSTFGLSEYTRPGTGGRQVVSWVGGEPRRTPYSELRTRRPVVAVVDTGCGKHDWFDDGPDDGGRPLVRRGPEVAPAARAGLTDAGTDPEQHGNIAGPLDGALDSHSGHGTFICGLIRQLCPDADLLTIRVMESDGVVHEGLLLDAIEDLYTLHSNYLEGRSEYASPVDVLVLSLGYYHEEPGDWAFDIPLGYALKQLSKLGVMVVCAAGNSATTRPMFPAAFAPWKGTSPKTDRVPVVSVGSLNPNGSIALFSNDGPWVLTREVGASVVSTVPKSLQGSSQATVSYRDGKDVRSTIDPDDFKSGFALWSGTSFSAPVLAGKLTQALMDTGRLEPKVSDGQSADERSKDEKARDAVRRAWDVLAKSLPSLDGAQGKQRDEPAGAAPASQRQTSRADTALVPAEAASGEPAALSGEAGCRDET